MQGMPHLVAQHAGGTMTSIASTRLGHMKLVISPFRASSAIWQRAICFPPKKRKLSDALSTRCGKQGLRHLAMPDPTPHSDARDTPRHWHTSQPRAGGRER